MKNDAATTLRSNNETKDQSLGDEALQDHQLDPKSRNTMSFEQFKSMAINPYARLGLQTLIEASKKT